MIKIKNISAFHTDYIKMVLISSPEIKASKGLIGSITVTDKNILLKDKKGRYLDSKSTLKEMARFEKAVGL